MQYAFIFIFDSTLCNDCDNVSDTATHITVETLKDEIWD